MKIIRNLRACAHKLLMTLLVVTTVMVLPLSGAFAQEPQDAYTTASVTFLDGDLEMVGDLSGSGLDFDFGRHTIPTQFVRYFAENANEGSPVNHVLQVEDARAGSGNWRITVQLSNFEGASEDDSFDAAINLKNPDVANTNTAAGTAGLNVVNDIQIMSGRDETLVIQADASLLRGIYSAEWTNDDVSLEIDEIEAMKIGVAAYTASLTWTLSVGP